MQLGEILLCMGYIEEDQLHQALQQQRVNPGQLLGLILMELGYIDEEQLTRALKAQVRLKTHNPAKVC